MPLLEFDLATLLQDVVSRGGSDLHLIHGIPPIARIAGEIGALPYAALTSDGINELLDPFLTPAQKEIFKSEARVNCGHSIAEVGRFRFSVYQSIGTTGATIRVIPNKNYPLTSLGLPPIVGTLASKKSGIIFITGPPAAARARRWPP